MTKKKPETGETKPERPVVIVPLTDFHADPWETGDPKAVAFIGGVMSSPVPAEFAARMRAEGKAMEAA